MLIAVIVIAAEATNENKMVSAKNTIANPGILSEQRIWLYALSTLAPILTVACEGNQGK